MNELHENGEPEIDAATNAAIANIYKELEVAQKFLGQLQGLGLTSADEQADYLTALIGLVAAGAVPDQIREIAKQVGAGLSKPRPTKAGQLSAEHLGKTITVSFLRSKVTGTLDEIKHLTEVTCDDRRGNPIGTENWVALTIGGIAQRQIGAGTQITLEDES